MRISAVLLVLSWVFWLPTGAGSAQAAVSIDWVTVGSPGNTCEHWGRPCVGGVADEYRISKFEISNAEYAEFLNAVAAADVNALYNTKMGSASSHGGITRSGSPGSYRYDTIAGRENMPVNWVSFWDAVRFANWLHNGQPAGAQNSTTTEDGAYTLTPAVIEARSVERNAKATVFVPSWSEWYKAAYYRDGGAATEFYVPSPWFWDYPAGSDTQTECAMPGPTANQANCASAVGDLTDRGSYTGSPSPSGTFDQGGNVQEWIEADRPGPHGSYRGGSFRLGVVGLGKPFRIGGGKTAEDSDLGIRVASLASESRGAGGTEKSGATPPMDQPVAGVSFAPPNRWQDPCIRAMDGIEASTYGPSWLNKMRWRLRWGKALKLLRSGADAGHLPSIHYLLSFPDRGLEEVGLPGLDDREVLTRALFEAGFPLASKPGTEDAFTGGFQGNHEHPPRPPVFSERMSEEQRAKFKKHLDVEEAYYRSRGDYITHAESAELRRAYIESKHWSAARGDTSSWWELEQAYGWIADSFGGGVEFRIEQYALSELLKKLDGHEPQYNAHALTQEHLTYMYLSEPEVSRARELGKRYVKDLWPRRIKRDQPEEVCRLQPQFVSDSAPYANLQPVLRVLELPKPPKDPKPPSTARMSAPISIEIIDTPVKTNCVRVREDGSVERVGNMNMQIGQNGGIRRCEP